MCVCVYVCVCVCMCVCVCVYVCVYVRLRLQTYAFSELLIDFQQSIPRQWFTGEFYRAHLCVNFSSCSLLLSSVQLVFVFDTFCPIFLLIASTQNVPLNPLAPIENESLGTF